MWFTRVQLASDARTSFDEYKVSPVVRNVSSIVIIIIIIIKQYLSAVYVCYYCNANVDSADCCRLLLLPMDV